MWAKPKYTSTQDVAEVALAAALLSPMLLRVSIVLAFQKRWTSYVVLSVRRFTRALKSVPSGHAWVFLAKLWRVAFFLGLNKVAALER